MDNTVRDFPTCLFVCLSALGASRLIHISVEFHNGSITPIPPLPNTPTPPLPIPIWKREELDELPSDTSGEGSDHSDASSSAWSPAKRRKVGSNDDMKSNLSDVCSSPNISVDSPSDVESSEFEDTEDASGSDEETTLNAKREIRNRNRARQGLSPRMFLDSDDEWYAQFES